MKAPALVFAAVLALLSLRSGPLHIADTYLDPIAKVDAQDEAMYAHSAIHFSQHGDWLTPRYQGRFALYKPPLLAWLAGLSVKLLGFANWTLRLPAMLAAALTAALVWLWGGRSDLPGRAPLAGASAVLLLVSNHLWLTLSSLCLTDTLLAAFVTTSCFVLAADPNLKFGRSRWTFILATAAAVMVKSVAGVLPVLILLLYCALARRWERPPWRRVLAILLAAAALVLPWCLYQLAVHPKWFWNEFVLSEIFTYGVRSPIQTTAENPVLFYVKRLFLLDPILAILAPPAIWYAVRRRQTVLLAWTIVVFAAAFLWSYRNVTYLAPAIPALAILAGGLMRGRWPAAFLAAALLVKCAFPAEPWGIDLRPRVLHPSIALLDGYARLQRGREFILVDPFEGFYSATLPLARVRYCFTNPGGIPPQGALDLHWLGILVTAGEFAHMAELDPVWRTRLRQWDLDSAEPIATAIIARSRSEVAQLIADRPQADFLLPAQFRGEAAKSANRERISGESAGGYFLALAP